MRTKPATVALILALGGVQSAWAQGTTGGLDPTAFAARERGRAMVYWSWSPDSRAPAQYGVRFDTTVRAGGLARPVSVVDFGFSRSRATLRTFGALAYDSSDTEPSDPSDSLKVETLKKPVFWVGVTAAALAISCATRNFPCKDKEDNSGGSTSTPGDGRR